MTGNKNHGPSFRKDLDNLVSTPSGVASFVAFLVIGLVICCVLFAIFL